MIHRCLFFCMNERVEPYRVKGTGFQPIKYQGEVDFGQTEIQFWPWWESFCSYDPDCDMIDFCIIGESTGFFNNLTYKPVETSAWTIDEIRDFFCEHTRYSSLTLQVNDGAAETCIEIKNPKILGQPLNCGVELYTIPSGNNIAPEAASVQAAEETEDCSDPQDEAPINEEMSSEDDSPLRKHYLEQLGRIRNN